MISVLHLLHAIAAKRGDGLHPELCRRSDKPDEPTPAPQEPWQQFAPPDPHR
jgi:hypothetical protein